MMDNTQHWQRDLLCVCSYIIFDDIPGRNISGRFDTHFNTYAIYWRPGGIVDHALLVYTYLTAMREPLEAIAILRQALWLRGYIEGALRVGQYLTWLEAALAGPAAADRGTA
jgi:hypothetical protein